jgi:hypothetical protein
MGTNTFENFAEHRMSLDRAAADQDKDGSRFNSYEPSSVLGGARMLGISSA